MLYALKRYERLPHGEGKKPLSSSWRLRELYQCSFLHYALTFILGLGLGFTAAVPFLMRSSSPKVHRLPPVIPPQVFTPQIPVSWVPDERYVGFSDFSSRMWHELTQPTEAVWLENPSQYGLGGGFEAKFNHSSKSELTPQFYHISNLHQIHCLNIIRLRYYKLQLDLPSPSKISETAAGDTAYQVDHCIEYLRMTIMCGKNWVVEEDSPPGTPRELKINTFGHPIGWGGIRNCVNWEALTTWQKVQLEAYKGTWPELK